MPQILIVDDHSIVRTGIKLLLENQLDIVCDEASDGMTTLELLKEKIYDVILLDINMPDTDCGALLATILRVSPETNVLIFSMNEEELFARHYMKLGAKGFLSKKSSESEIILAIKQVLGGRRYISREFAEILGDEISGVKTINPFNTLSERELTVVGYLIKGVKISTISEIMNLHPSTISTYRIRIFEKLNIKNLIDLTELARIYNFK